MTLQLYIGNKNYSSWSMRPWVLLHHMGVDFQEVMIRFDSFDANSNEQDFLDFEEPYRLKNEAI